MDQSTFLLIVVVLILILVFAVLSKRKASRVDYDYRKKSTFLTSLEVELYRKLSDLTANRPILLFPKVRLANLVEPVSQMHQLAASYPTQPRCVDFLLCDEESLLPIMAVMTGSESKDDNLDEILKKAKFPVYYAESVDLNQVIEEQLIAFQKEG